MFGLLAVLLVAGMVLGSLVGLSLAAGEVDILSQLARPYIRSVIGFTVWQAGLSAFISVSLAIPLARSLHRQPRFFGRGLLVRLTSISLVVPSMVAIIGVIGVHGRNGWLNDLLVLFGLPRQDYLYGINGILIAHVFFNLPLVTRLLLNGLMRIPEHQWKIASQLGMSGWNLFRYLEWPTLRGLLSGAFGIVFLLCFTSFAIVLSLGGGPGSATLEVAIYQALRFDFDLSAAVSLSFIQILVCMGLAMAFFTKPQAMNVGPEPGAGMIRFDTPQWPGRSLDGLVIALSGLFLLTPFMAVAWKALGGDGPVILGAPAFWRALSSTLVISIIAGMLSTVGALVIAQLMARLRLRAHGVGAKYASIFELTGMLTLILPPITLATGLFLLFRTWFDMQTLGWVLVVLINALFTLAFSLRILVSPVHQQMQQCQRLSHSLGLSALQTWRFALWPGLRSPIAYALAVSTTLACGDMGVIALFGTETLSTLPLLIYRLLGGYRLDQAAVVALVLCFVCFFLFVLIEKYVGVGHAARE